MMNALEAILRRPRSVLAVMVVMLIAGISAYMTLPRENQPAIDIPYLYVSVSQTGVSPADANRLLVRPLEIELKDLDGLKSMRSTARNGHASIFLEFDINFDKDQALSDTKDRVDRAKPNLPDDANDPTVNEININSFGTITVALYGRVPERTLTRRATELKDALEGLNTVLDVSMSGDREEVLEITVDLLKLESYNLTTSELFDALARNNLVVPAGTLDTGQGKFAIEVPGLIETARDVFTLPLKSDGTTVVTFADVATIQRTFKDVTEYTRINGQPAIVLAVNKRLGVNIVELSNQTRAVTEEMAADWPRALEHSYMIDQAKFAMRMFNSLQSSVLTAVALVAIVSVALLGVRPALMIGLSIPLSFMTGFLFLQIMGMTINMMIMFGLVLTVGMLVDAAIVIVEYADRKISEGMARREAFIRAARLMFMPILSSTATTLAAFLPLLLWPGILGKFMSYLPIMVIVTLSASFITAMIFLPVIGGFVARRKVSEKEKRSAQALSGADSFDAKKVRGVTGAYVRALAFLVRHPIAALVVGLGLIGSIYGAYMANPTGMQAFPDIEPEFATVAVTGRGNFSPEEVLSLLVEVEKRVLTVAGIKDLALNFGSAGAVASVPPDTIGNLQLEFLTYKDRRKADAIYAEIRAKVADISGIGVELISEESGPPTGKDVSLRVVSDTYESLAPVVAKVRGYVERELGDMIEAEDGRPLPGIDWEIGVDRELAARFGIGVREISPYVQLVTSGVQIGTYRPEDAIDELEIRIRLPRDERTFSAFDTMKISTPSGQVPVSNFVTRKAVPKVADIKRWDSRYYMFVGANVGTEGVMAAEKVDALKDWVNAQSWPDDIEFEFTGADEQTQETNAFMVQAGLGALFLMFLILLTEFNSFYQVFVTLSTVVMSTAGVLLGLMVTGQPFSAIMTGIGIVSLAGIVVNNSIVLIDTFDRFKKDGAAPEKAILMTAAQRIRPVMLTTITTVFGLLPMALGINIDFFARVIEVGGPSGAWWIQLSTALIFGLSFSTVLTLVLVPVMLTAPTLWWRQIKGLAAFAGSVPAAIGALFDRPRRQLAAAGPDGKAAALAAPANPAANGDSGAPVERAQAGIGKAKGKTASPTNRQAAE